MIKSSDLKKIEAHALKTFPLECYGLFIGTFDQDRVEVKEVVNGKNMAGSPVAFEADPEFVYVEHTKAEKRGLRLVGIYHSHPNLHAFVSSRDADFMKYWQNLAWLILGLSEDRVFESKAFSMKEDKIEELEVVVS